MPRIDLMTEFGLLTLCQLSLGPYLAYACFNLFLDPFGMFSSFPSVKCLSKQAFQLLDPHLVDSLDFTLEE